VRTQVIIACLVAAISVVPARGSDASAGDKTHRTTASTRHHKPGKPAVHRERRKETGHTRRAHSKGHEDRSASTRKRASAHRHQAKKRQSHVAAGSHQRRHRTVAQQSRSRHPTSPHKQLAKRSGHNRHHQVAAHAGKPRMVAAKAVPGRGVARLDEGVWHQPVPLFGSLQLREAPGLGHRFLGAPRLSAGSALVIDRDQDRILYQKNSMERLPIASVTKLMTAMVVLDAHQPPDEILTVTEADVDRLKHSRSRLPVGTRLTRAELLHLALLASENRAASALSRNYPGGERAFIAAMNQKARFLGMLSTHFDDPTGLTPTNTSTAADLARMVQAAYTYPTIRAITSSSEYVVEQQGRLDGVRFLNTNRLVRSGRWEIGLSKTGYIEEAGRCLVMEAQIGGRSTFIVLLHDEGGRGSHFADATRLRKWIERREMLSAKD
jgi:D-alanyl-D-alanine endopeptidase (penicillin-binding protein 7)